MNEQQSTDRAALALQLAANIWYAMALAGKTGWDKAAPEAVLLTASRFYLWLEEHKP